MDLISDSVVNLKCSPLLTRYKDGHFDSVSNFWTAVSRQPEYEVISRVALLLCLIPHSNAIAERVFSMIGKNLTASRKSLKKDTTLTSIMIIKCAQLSESFEPSVELQAKAKSAARLALLGD